MPNPTAIVIRAALPALLLAAVAWPARADARPRPFPTLGGGVVSSTADEDAHGYLWFGVAVRPGNELSGRFVAAAIDIDFHGDAATVVPNMRVGWAGFHNRKAWIPIVQSYFIVGYGKQQVEGRLQDVFRIGSGFCIPYMFRAAEFGLAVPTTLELTLDVGTQDTTLALRLGWGF